MAHYFFNVSPTKIKLKITQKNILKYNEMTF